MKTLVLNSIVWVSLVCLVFGQESRYETVTLSASTGTSATNSLSIADYETGEIVFNTFTTGQNFVFPVVNIVKNGLTFPSVGTASSLGLTGQIVRGPATFVFTQDSGGNTQACSLFTVKITPVSFPPDRTLIVPPGTNQVLVSLESSTNLVNWVAATNGVYGSPISANFFRIHLVTLTP